MCLHVHEREEEGELCGDDCASPALINATNLARIIDGAGIEILDNYSLSICELCNTEKLLASSKPWHGICLVVVIRQMSYSQMKIFWVHVSLLGIVPLASY